MTSLAFRSATDLAALVRQREISSEELLDLYLSRVERLNPPLNALVFMDIAAARKRAREADEALRQGELWGPLHGVPMTLKDTFDVAGMPSTWGVTELKDNYPAKHAPLAERFMDAGAIIFGKTNVAAYHIGGVTQNELYGATSNPWDLTRSPGGSAGGAGAALAAGLTSLDVGLDFSGGTRSIAHYCGICAHKPTYGVTNLMGTVLPGIGAKPDLAVIGPLARGVDDLKLMLSLIVGPDPADAVAWTLNLPPPRREGVAGLRVALMHDHPRFPVDGSIADAIQTVADFLAGKGAEIDEAARPAFDMAAAFRVFMGLLTLPLAARRRDEQFWTRISHVTKFVFESGAESGERNEADLFSHANWMMLDNARRMVCDAWAEFFKDYDVVLCPAAPVLAPLQDPEKPWHERRLDAGGRSVPAAETTFWGAMANLGNLPATVVPAGFTAGGLPVGVQIIGPLYGDHTCLALAQHLERHFHRFSAPPRWE